MLAYDLDHIPGRSPLPEVPAKYWHIAQLVIVVRDRFGPHLVTQLHSYAPQGHFSDSDRGEGHWVPPYVSFEVQVDDPPPMTVRDVKRILDESEEKERMAREVRVYAWRLGFGGLTVTHMGALTQLKRSLRVPQQWMVFRFHRYVVHVDRDFGLRNLADPEALRGLVHLPLSDLDDIVVPRERDGAAEWWFRGKPIASDLQALLTGEDRERLGEHPIDLGDEDFHRSEEGLIVFTDLAGWGTALQAASQLVGMGMDGDESAMRFFAQTTEAQYRFLSRIGPSYCQDTGDGIVAVFHRRVFDLRDVAERVIRASLVWLRSLEEQINRYLPPEKAVGSRFAIHVGQYQHGRIGQALSQSTAVRGSCIVETARLELGLANFARDEAGHMPKGSDELRHTLAISDEALPFCEEALRRFDGSLVALGHRILSAKESKMPAHVWRFRLDEP